MRIEQLIIELQKTIDRKVQSKEREILRLKKEVQIQKEIGGQWRNDYMRLNIKQGE